MFITRLLPLCGMALSAIVAMTLVTTVVASPVGNLYVERVPVADQQAAARSDAATIGMAPVLVRVSGSSTVLLNSDIQRAINKASRYLSKFSYQKTPLQPDTTAEGEEQLPYSLELQFRKPAILNLLRASNEPIWAEDRPATLMWLVVDDLIGRRLPFDDDETGLRQIVEASAARRGLPLVWPVYDLQEQATLSLDSLWAADPKTIELASQRYDAIGTLLGRLLGTSDGKWRVAWEYSFNGASTYWDSECERLDDCVAGPIDAVAELLSSRYALISTDQGNIAKVKVAGINSFEDYGSLLFYFEDLIAVSDVALDTINGDVFEFTLGLTADREKLEELISLNKRLLPVPTVEGSDVTISDNSLVYQWR